MKDHITHLIFIIIPGNFVVLVSGNGLNRKLMFTVEITEANLIDHGT